jgi:hypothetical protein
MTTKFHYVIIDIESADGTNWGYYPEPGAIYLADAYSDLEAGQMRSAHLQWTEYISTAILFDTAESAYEAIQAVWKSVVVCPAVLMITDAHLDVAKDDIIYHINARAEKRRQENEDQRKMLETLQNLNKISSHLTDMGISL